MQSLVMTLVEMRELAPNVEFFGRVLGKESARKRKKT